MFHTSIPREGRARKLRRVSAVIDERLLLALLKTNPELRFQSEPFMWLISFVEFNLMLPALAGASQNKQRFRETATLSQLGPKTTTAARTRTAHTCARVDSRLADPWTAELTSLAASLIQTQSHSQEPASRANCQLCVKSPLCEETEEITVEPAWKQQEKLLMLTWKYQRLITAWFLYLTDTGCSSC